MRLVRGGGGSWEQPIMNVIKCVVPIHVCLLCGYLLCSMYASFMLMCLLRSVCVSFMLMCLLRSMCVPTPFYLAGTYIVYIQYF